jgi:hypothetical protein
MKGQFECAPNSGSLIIIDAPKELHLVDEASDYLIEDQYFRIAQGNRKVKKLNASSAVWREYRLRASVGQATAAA